MMTLAQTPPATPIPVHVTGSASTLLLKIIAILMAVQAFVGVLLIVMLMAIVGALANSSRRRWRHRADP